MKTIYAGETGSTVYQRPLLNLSRIIAGRNNECLNEHSSESTRTVDIFLIFRHEKCNEGELIRKVGEVIWIKILGLFLVKTCRHPSPPSPQK